mgnify:CR=1 FL=1
MPSDQLYKDYARLPLPKLKKVSGYSVNGLTKKEAIERLESFGKNEIKKGKKGWHQILVRQFKSSFTYLLIVAGLLAFFLKEYIDSVMIFIFISINAVLGFVQEYKSEKAAELLKKYVSVRARVRRDGHESIIDAEEIVPGDIVIVEAGDIIPADIRFIRENNLTLDESPLTGESVPIKKSEKAVLSKNLEIHEASNIGFSGTRVVEGRGEGFVFATGKDTSIGEIAKLTEETVRVSSFEKGLDKFSRFVLYMVLITLSLVFSANLIVKGDKIEFFELVLFSIALAVSVIPEAFPVVTSVSLSQGALKLAKEKVVVRRLSAIEDLGGIEILCTDKTGTLTENKLTVSRLNSGDKDKCLKYAAIATSFLNEKQKEPNNAFDIALWEKLDEKDRKVISAIDRIAEIPFTPDRRRNSVAVRIGKEIEIVVRGAPEVIMPLCKNLTKRMADKYQNWSESEGIGGKRVLAVACRPFKKAAGNYTEKDENGLVFLGLISFIDPIKETTRYAVREAKKLGIKVKILTGDGREVAGAVGILIGLAKDDGQVITGAELESLSFEEQLKAIEEKSIFARVSPRQKYDIIKLLQQKHSVGFLGEGINDAPALQLADVSIVVESASDIAREASDIILLDQSLNVIISGIKQGRGIYSNTVKYIKATLTSNFGNFYAIAAATMVIDFLPMLPLQILLVNLLSDFPMIAIATDNVDEGELSSPKSYDIKSIVLVATLLGLISTTFDFIFFGMFFRISPEVLHTNWFLGSILTELILLFSVRTKLPFFKARRPSGLLLWLTLTVITITVAIPFTSVGQDTFGFVRPTAYYLSLIFIVVLTYFATTEAVKLLYYKYVGNRHRQVVA